MSKLTLEEAISHCLEVAEKNETQADKIGRQLIGTAKDREATDCRECAAEHRQLAEWLTDYKELKNSIGAVKLSNMKEALKLIRAYKAENIAQKKLIAEYKRLLKAAVDDLNFESQCRNCKHKEYGLNTVCKECRGNKYEWRYADEFKKNDRRGR